MVIGLRDGTISSDGLDTFKLGYEFVRDEIGMRRDSLKRHAGQDDKVVVVKTRRAPEFRRIQERALLHAPRRMAATHELAAILRDASLRDAPQDELDRSKLSDRGLSSAQPHSGDNADFFPSLTASRHAGTLWRRSHFRTARSGFDRPHVQTVRFPDLGAVRGRNAGRNMTNAAYVRRRLSAS